MERKPLLVAALWYVAAIFFFIAAGIGKNIPYVAIGALYLCIGSCYLVLHNRHIKIDVEGSKQS